MDTVNETIFRPPREVSAPPPEYPAPAPEIQPPPPEFGYCAPKQPDERKKRRYLKRFIAVPLVLLLGFLTFAGQSLPQPDTNVTPASPTEPAASEPVSSEPDTQEEPSSEQENPAPYPLADRNMLVTVYSGRFDENYEIPVLLQEEVSELNFESMNLPICPPQEGYTFSGYVIHTGNNFLHPEPEPPNTPKAVIPLTDQLLTKADVEKTPLASDGKRYVNIYPVWIAARSPEPSDVTFVLDDGQGHRTTYIDDSPIASEGFHYLVAFPETKRPGYVFGGWYTADGTRVDALQSFMDFFVPTEYDAYGNVVDCDWDSPITDMVLTARWYPEE